VKSTAEEKLIQIKDFLANMGEGNTPAILTTQTTAKQVVPTDNDIPKLLYSSAARTISYDVCNSHEIPSRWSMENQRYVYGLHHSRTILGGNLQKAQDLPARKSVAGTSSWCNLSGNAEEGVGDSKIRGERNL
jgi:hypothetical protein